MGLGEKMDGCGRFMKFVMFVVNFVILIGGFATLVVGSMTVANKSYMEELFGNNLYMSSSYILIGTGVLIILISFLGCLGSVKEIKCMLLTYFIIILVIFVTLLIGGILGYVFRDKVKDSMRTGMTNAIRKYDEDHKSIMDAWDETQRRLKCCGVEEGHSDWAENNYLSNDNKKVPKSCCKLKNDGTPEDCQTSPTSTNSYTEGCYSTAVMFAKDHAKLIGGVGVGIACLMILGMVFSLALFKLIE